MMDDVSGELKAFLDYVAGKKSEDSFVKRLEEAVKAAKKNREWRHEYMTLLMRDQENMERGIEKGKLEGRAEEIIETGYEFQLSENDILGRLQKNWICLCRQPGNICRGLGNKGITGWQKRK